jgi:hypothetical protein
MRKSITTLTLLVAGLVAAAHVGGTGAAMANPYPIEWSNASIVYVHCRRTYHCSWKVKDHVKVRRCHVCP